MADDLISKLMPKQGPLYTGPLKFGGRYFNAAKSLQGAVIGIGKAYAKMPDGAYILCDVRIEMNVEDAKKTATDILQSARKYRRSDWRP